MSVLMQVIAVDVAALLIGIAIELFLRFKDDQYWDAVVDSKILDALLDAVEDKTIYYVKIDDTVLVKEEHIDEYREKKLKEQENES